MKNHQLTGQIVDYWLKKAGRSHSEMKGFTRTALRAISLDRGS